MVKSLPISSLEVGKIMMLAYYLEINLEYHIKINGHLKVSLLKLPEVKSLIIFRLISLS